MRTPTFCSPTRRARPRSSRAAAVAGSEPATRRLLDASANAAACPVEGKTLADLAAKKNPACAKHIARALSPEGAAERLLEAAEKGRVAAVAAMLASNLVADPNAVVDDDGWTAALRRRGGTPELVRLLLQKGFSADAEAKDGATPVELAEEEEHEDAARILREGVE